MSHSAADVAKAASRAFDDLEGFDATQTVHAGTIEATARIRFAKPDRCSVEYSTYANPFNDLEERLAHGVPFVPEELTGMTLAFDGRQSLLLDAGSGTAVLRSGRHVAEPIPGYQVLCELGFLETLTHDFLVRDAGTETIDGRPSLLIGLKPKTAHRSQLLRAVSFPIRRAVIAFDEESLFPNRIQFFPIADSIVGSILPASHPITISYQRVRAGPPPADAFDLAPPEGTRLFREMHVAVDALPDETPFRCNLDALPDHGLSPHRSAGLFAETDSDRAYVVASFATTSSLVTLRAGNYLSRAMARRKARLAEEGDEVKIGALTGRRLDRGSQMPTSNPERPAQMFDVSWERDGTFWFLSADGVDAETLIEIASDLNSRNAESA